MSLRRPWSRLEGRLLATAVGIGLLASVLTTVVVARVAIVLMVERTAQIQAPSIAAGTAECEADPTTFHLHRDAYQVFSYDLQGRSRNPDAPPIDEALLAEVLATGGIAHRIEHRVPLRGRFALQVAGEGPCAVSMVSWQMKPEVARRVHRALPIAFVGTIAMAIAALLWAALRPLLRRLRRLEGAASGLGDDAAYRSAADGSPDAVGAISQALDTAHERLVAQSTRLQGRHRVLERELADIAHDIRTPLASVQARLDQLRSHADADAAEALAASLGDLTYLGSLVDNLLAAARIRDGAPLSASRPIDMGRVVDQTRDRFAPLGTLRGMAVDAARPDEPVWVRCDEILAERLVANLVHNAVRHASRPGGEGQVFVRLTTDGEWFELAVIDDGPGLDPSVEARLHTLRAPRPGQRRPHVRGEGLGLRIAVGICDAAAWTLSLERAEGGGLRAVVSGRIARA